MATENQADESVLEPVPAKQTSGDNTQSAPDVITVQTDEDGNVTIAGDNVDELLTEIQNEEREEATWQSKTTAQIAQLQEQVISIQSAMMSQVTNQGQATEAMLSTLTAIQAQIAELKPLPSLETRQTESILEPENVLQEAQAITEPAEKAVRKAKSRWI